MGESLGYRLRGHSLKNPLRTPYAPESHVWGKTLLSSCFQIISGKDLDKSFTKQTSVSGVLGLIVGFEDVANFAASAKMRTRNSSRKRFVARVLSELARAGEARERDRVT